MREELSMKNIDYFVKEITSLGIKSTEGILEYGLTMLDAKGSLCASDYAKFLEKTHYAEKSSSVRKWHCIGKAYMRLKPIAYKLPPNWSTLYKLSALSIDKFDLLERKNVLSPTITAKEIDDALSKKNSKKYKPIKFILKFDSDVLPEFLKQIHDLIDKSLPSSVCVMNLTDEAERLLDAATSNSTQLKLAA